MMVYTAGMGAGAWGGNGGEGAGGGAGAEEEEDDAKARKARSDFVPTVDQFQVVDFLRRDVVEFLLRSTTADAYFASDREAREMLQREHANARAFVERQRRVIDAVSEALYEKKSLDAEARELAAEPPVYERGARLPPLQQVAQGPSRDVRPSLALDRERTTLALPSCN